MDAIIGYAGGWWGDGRRAGTRPVQITLKFEQNLAKWKGGRNSHFFEMFL